VRQVFVGAVLVVAVTAALIEAHSHSPYNCVGLEGCNTARQGRALSLTAYDLLRIGAWALVIVGALLIVTGLVRHWGSQARR